MTKVKFSGLGITYAQGSMGDQVLTRNFYGAYYKTKIPGPAVISPALAAWQAQFSAVEAIWKILTDEQRNAWIAEARRVYWRTDKLAKRQRHTGYTLFMYVNLNRILLTLATLTDPPLNIAPPVINFFSLTYTVATFLSVRVLSSGNGRAAVYASDQLSPGRMSNNQLFYFMRIGPLIAGNIPFDFLTEYTARFGAPVSGKKIFVRVDPMSTSGRRMVPAYGSIIIP